MTLDQLKDRALDIVRAYENILLLDLDSPSSAEPPSHAAALALNVLIQSTVVGLTPGMDPFDAILATVLLVLLWSFATKIACSGPAWRSVLSFNLNLLTFWLAATILIISVASFVITNPIAVWLRAAFVALCLLVSVPLHIFFRSRLPWRQKIIYTVALLATGTGFTWALLLRPLSV